MALIYLKPDLFREGKMFRCHAPLMLRTETYKYLAALPRESHRRNLATLNFMRLLLLQNKCLFDMNQPFSFFQLIKDIGWLEYSVLQR